MTPKRTVRGASACLFDDEGRVLFIPREKEPYRGSLAFPGGSIEEGETALAAAKRELHEESGHIARGEPFAAFDVTLETSDTVFTITSFAFDAFDVTGVGELAARWLSPAEAAREGLTTGVDRALEHFVRARHQRGQ
ncbi:MAG: NUDIX domain-containing protein [Polyangiaceae bacterium]